MKIIALRVVLMGEIEGKRERFFSTGSEGVKALSSYLQQQNIDMFRAGLAQVHIIVDCKENNEQIHYLDVLAANHASLKEARDIVDASMNSLDPNVAKAILAQTKWADLIRAVRDSTVRDSTFASAAELTERIYKVIKYCGGYAIAV